MPRALDNEIVQPPSTVENPIQIQAGYNSEEYTRGIPVSMYVDAMAVTCTYISYFGVLWAVMVHVIDDLTTIIGITVFLTALLVCAWVRLLRDKKSYDLYIQRLRESRRYTVEYREGHEYLLRIP